MAMCGFQEFCETPEPLSMVASAHGFVVASPTAKMNPFRECLRVEMVHQNVFIHGIVRVLAIDFADIWY